MGEHPTILKTIALGCLGLLVLGGEAIARDEDAACRKEEQALRERAAEKCGEFSKLLNPSGCIAVQNDLKAFANGGCKKRNGTGSTIERSASPPTPPPMPTEPSPASASQRALGKPLDPAQLQRENDLLKAEIIRLRTEIERLRAAGK
jgi:hypothetical protein